MINSQTQMNFNKRIFHPKFKLSILLVFFMSLLTSVFLVSCQTEMDPPKSPKSYEGRILLFYIGDDETKSTGYSPGIYELKQDQESPQLLWANLPVELNDVSPIISPDGSLALLQSDYLKDGFLVPSYYLLNLQTGEGHIFYYPGSLADVAFSPDSHYLAYAFRDSLVIYNLHDIDFIELEKSMLMFGANEHSEMRDHSIELLYSHCNGYPCKACLPIDYPVWVNNETVVVATDTRYLDPSFNFQVGTPCGTNGNLDLFMVARVDGKFIANVKAPYAMDLPLKNLYTNQVGAAFIIRDSSNGSDNSYSLSWVDVNAIVEKGEIIQDSIGYVNLDTFSIAPDGKSMLWFDKYWKLYDTTTKKITKLQHYPDLVKLSSCLWSPGGESVTCLGLLNNGNNQLFFLPFSGENPIEIFTWNNNLLNSGWYLLGWQPSK
jgi:hypothetical protein